MILDGLAGAWDILSNPIFVFWLIGGTLLGLILGVIPGIGSINGIAMVLPFAFFMAPNQVFPLIIAMEAVGYTGGSISAVLLGIPGTPVNVVTTFDGYPMTQKGEGERALGAALGASMMGGVISGILALGMIFLVVPFIMAVGSADMFFIIILGLAFIAILSKGSRIKGFISGILGLVISFIGVQPVTSTARFTFDTAYLYEGIPLVPLALGMFAITMMIHFSVSGATVSPAALAAKSLGLRGIFKGIKDIFIHWWLFIRSTIIGYIIGVIPGVGGEVAIFVAYGQAKQLSKHPEKFGTGVVEGVIAPESSNNAKDGGALLTTLILGVPGSAVMSLVIGALLMTGFSPGPEMITKNLDLTLSMLYALILANILGGVICIFAGPSLVKLAKIPTSIMIPVIMSVLFVSAYSYRGSFTDLFSLLIAGAVAFFMERFGYNKAALFLGYILGWSWEYYFFLALGSSGPLFFLRPISITVIILTVAFLFYNPLKKIILRCVKGKVCSQ